jgi:hypothetical protein
LKALARATEPGIGQPTVTANNCTRCIAALPCTSKA